MSAAEVEAVVWAMRFLLALGVLWVFVWLAEEWDGPP